MAITGQVTVNSNLFPAIAAQMDSRINAAFDHAVQTLFAVADPLTRKDTGRLVSDKTIERSDFNRIVIWNAPYAQFQNHGTIFMEGTQFGDRGFDAASPVLVADLAKVFA